MLEMSCKKEDTDIYYPEHQSLQLAPFPGIVVRGWHVCV